LLTSRPVSLLVTVGDRGASAALLATVKSQPAAFTYRSHWIQVAALIVQEINLGRVRRPDDLIVHGVASRQTRAAVADSPVVEG
jgi:hypothetical protein